MDENLKEEVAIQVDETVNEAVAIQVDEDEVVPGVYEKVNEAAQTTEEMQSDEGELADQNKKKEMDEEESEYMHAFAGVHLIT